MPAPLTTALDINSGTLVLAAGDQDTDRGLRIGYSHERWPRIKITPQAGIFTGDGQSEPATAFGGSGALDLSALSGVTLTDNAGTDLDNLGTGPTAPSRWWLTAGTQANPITVAQPTVKLSSTFGVTLATAGALANSEKSGTTFEAYAQDAPGCGVQITGVLGSAKMLTATGSDAVGVYGIGTVSGLGTGIGTGGYFEGRRNVNTGKALGFEVRVSNITGTNGSYSSAGLSDTQGLWITSAGTAGASSGTGISLGAIGGSQFRVGYGAVAGSIADSTFRDDSSSTVSLDVRGTHTYALDTSAFTPAASSRAIRLGNTHRFSAVNAAGNGVVDLFACDSSDRLQFFPGTPGNVVFSNGVNLVFSTGTTGSQIGTGATQKLGFWGATPIVRPTVTGDRAGNAGLASLLSTLATEGLVVDSTTAGTLPAAAGMVLIATTTLGASAAAITFSSIPQTYKTLVLVVTGRCDLAAAGSDSLAIRFNGDTAANYDDQELLGLGATAAAAGTITRTKGRVGALAAVNAATNVSGTSVVTIPNYSGTTWRKEAIGDTYVARADTAAGQDRESWATGWHSTAAITQIDVLADTATNLLTGTVASLYGMV